MFWMWSGFIALVLSLIGLDLFVVNRRAHVVHVREALVSSAVWTALALAFNVVVYFAYRGHWHGLGLHPSHIHPHGLGGRDAAVAFLTGYVIELSLSVDNLFVMSVIFGYFGIPALYQHRVLIWGILGAQVMRGAMIGLGATLIARFDWILYLFGAFLLFTAWRMLSGDIEPNPRNNLLVRLARRVFPMTHELRGPRFVVRDHEIPPDRIEEPEGEEPAAAGELPAALPAGPGGGGAARVAAASGRARHGLRPRGRWVLTPLALALVVVETTDLLFAVDSIPAIFAVTTDPFLVFTSNIFAVLGLRSLYFVLAGVLEKFKYLEVSLAAILALIGLKMLGRSWLDDIPNVSLWTLAVVIGILAVAVVASLVAARREVPKRDDRRA